MIVSILLIFYGTIALYIGASYLSKENNNTVMRNCLSIAGVLVFLWCFGYGVMGLCEDPTYCNLWRNVALVGVLSYPIVQLIFVRYFTGLMKKGFTALIVFCNILGLISYVLLIQPGVVEFFPYNGRMAYSSQPCLGRTVEGIYVGLMVCLTSALGIITLFRARYKRMRKAIWILLISGFSLVFMMIPDTVFPMFGRVSIPTTGFGAFICYICYMYTADRRAVFNISTSSMNEYIYKNIDSSFLFFDPNGILLSANKHAEEYLNLPKKENILFSDIFVLSEEDALKLAHGTYRSEDGEIGVPIKGTNRRCSAAVTRIEDKYGDPMYYACILNDLTTEAQMYEETNSIKRQLDEEVKNKRREIELLTLETIETMANTLEAKDEYTKGHSSRVSEYSVLLAKKLGYDDTWVENLRIMALLHDVGKIAIPDRVLNKAGKLENAEFDVIKSHTVQGDLLLKGISSLGPIANVARHHHERYDGKGYPDKIAGENIELEARIVCIADSYDAMSSDRVYRKALPKSVIREELVKGRGTQFDPDLLEVFLKMFDAGELEGYAPESIYSNNILNLQDMLEDFSEQAEHKGANTLNHDELVKVYSYLRDRGARYDSDIRLVLITLSCSDPSKYKVEHMRKSMTAMEYSIVQCLRKSDLTSQVSETQHIVLLTNANVDYITSIVERIFANYYKNSLYTEIKLEYEVLEDIV